LIGTISDNVTLRLVLFLYWALFAFGPIFLLVRAMERFEKNVGRLLNSNSQTSTSVFSTEFVLTFCGAWALVMLLPAAIATMLTVYGPPDEGETLTFLIESFERWIFVIAFVAAFGISSMIVVVIIGDREGHPIFIPIIGAFALLLFVSSFFHFLFG